MRVRIDLEASLAPSDLQATRAPNARAELALRGLGVAYVVLFLALAWAPADRTTWLLENLIAVPTAIWLLVVGPRSALGRSSRALMFVFLALHAIGSHYTYSHVPYASWAEQWLGLSLDPSRNHYDRAVHLAFGLLVTWPLIELWRPRVPGRDGLAILLGLLTSTGLSTLYELLEWGAAAIAAPETGIAFVGAQGDVWDAQKDTALALVGTLLVCAIAWACLRGARRAAPGDPQAPRRARAARRRDP